MRFNLVPAPATNLNWLEADVELEARVVGGRSPFLDRVKVTLNLGTRTTGGTAHRFYRADLEVVTLENGAAHFRFYLPPEVLKRDGIAGGEPEFWTVKIVAAGETLPDSARNASVTLRDLERLRNFDAKLATEAPANDGVLLPQYLTPFAAAYPSATPSPVRRTQ